MRKVPVNETWRYEEAVEAPNLRWTEAASELAQLLNQKILSGKIALLVHSLALQQLQHQLWLELFITTTTPYSIH